jgi:hypothetical protein
MPARLVITPGAGITPCVGYGALARSARDSLRVFVPHVDPGLPMLERLESSSRNPHILLFQTFRSPIVLAGSRERSKTGSMGKEQVKFSPGSRSVM